MGSRGEALALLAQSEIQQSRLRHHRLRRVVAQRGRPFLLGAELRLHIGPEVPGAAHHVLARRAADLLRTSGASRVLVGAAMPLGLLAPGLRRAGADVVVALTHGHEVWWATVPGARAALRRVGDACDHLTTISDYTAARIGPALSPGARDRLRRLAPLVDSDVFRPGPEGRSPTAAPTVVAVEEPEPGTPAAPSPDAAGGPRWRTDAEAELRKIPFFVRGKARRNTERFAQERGVATITVDTLYDAKAHFGR